MTKPEKTVLVGTMVLMVIVLVFISFVPAVRYVWQSRYDHGYGEWECPTLQRSEHMQGIDGDNFISHLCSLNGIDPNDRTVSYQIQCPKCNDEWFLADEVTSFEWGETNPSRTDAAFVKVTPVGSILANFYTTYATIDKLSPGETYLLESKSGHTYCRSCGYPIGTDWSVYDLALVDGDNGITDPLFPIRPKKVTE